MPSTFTWLDYSEQERRRALDVISLFHLRDTVDELGIGSVRDAIADALSPGTTTIQTRARYFLFIPWIYLDLESKRVPSDRIARWARRAEEALIPELAQADDTEGVIGIEAGRTIKRLPSSVYWAGLRTWGILLSDGSRDQYHRSIDRFHERLRDHRALAREQLESGPEPVNWHPHLPDPPDGFPKGATLELRHDEAAYLRERILSAAQGTLLAHLADVGHGWDRVDFPWDHPRAEAFPDRVAWELHHARTFSEVIHGAALLYNLMLAEARSHEKWIEDYRARFEEWSAEIEARRDVVSDWNRDAFWSWVHENNPRLPPPTRSFVDRWVDLVQAAAEPLRLADNTEDGNPARRLIRDRESFLKRGRARLQSRRHLELWGGASGAAQLDFRWKITQTLLLDIIAGLER